MPVIEKQVIFIMFAMGILGGLGCYIWYRRKREECDRAPRRAQSLPTDSAELPVSNRMDLMADIKQRDACLHKDEENLSAQSLPTDSAEPPISTRVDLMADIKQLDAGVHEDEENLSAKIEEISLQRANESNSISQAPAKTKSHRRLGIYLPPRPRAASSSDAATINQPCSHLTNANAKKTPVSSSLPATPVERIDRSTHTPSEIPADVKYIVSVQIPLWLISRFIGKQGYSIKSMRQLSGAEFRVQRNLFVESSHTLCEITGSTKQIKAALDLIKQRFPEVTLDPNMKLFHGPKKKMPQKEPYHSINDGVTSFTQFSARVSHVDSLASIWIHFVDSSNAVCPWQMLYEKMNRVYAFASACSVECDEDEAAVITNGQLYAVKTIEGNFSRGLVKEILSTDDGGTTYRILLIDYGNCIDVNAERLIPLRYSYMLRCSCM